MKQFYKKNPELDSYGVINTAYVIFKNIIIIAAIACFILGIIYGINTKSFLLTLIIWAISAISLVIMFFFGLLSMSLYHNLYWARRNSEKILESLQSIAERKNAEKSDNTSENKSEKG